MEKKNILIIDDESMTHVILKALLGQEFELFFAKNAQDGIDLLAEKTIHLVLLDIQMPEISGIELLESLMIDTVLRDVPIIIITGKATEEIEEQAKKLGAVEFVDKQSIFSDKKSILPLIRKNISEKVIQPITILDYREDFKNIIRTLIKETVRGDFISACRKLGVGLMNSFEIDYVSFWTIQSLKPNLVVSLGDGQPEDFGPDEIMSEDAFKRIAINKKAYLTNNPTSETKGIFGDTAIKLGLSSEIGIPLFKISKEALMHNNMVVPPETKLFGFIIIKRNRVFTTKEFRILEKFTIQAGTILYELFRKLFQPKPDS